MTLPTWADRKGRASLVPLSKLQLLGVVKTGEERRQERSRGRDRGGEERAERGGRGGERRKEGKGMRGEREGGTKGGEKEEGEDKWSVSLLL